ncbi:MAG: hypothetical protein KJ614_08240 [Gammaproteobacteria bacterium]|uniref:hypothetical protein n=1 Tax=Rhodoferax sp. TaxID=50421 RepID=UPI001815CB9F|nr:hypothetical protein [Rhodoferax sp.]MBU3898903.1 hypothetical protein [Gammaproteobacteria bacterium]MBA3059524.1 hypothetical protein [Rhodoferax sp.]MBU3999094.1 hypothetical protein [Gammaproteobacteria bacterium]MBU4019379.1 hypothetical protein [Gammaproteobacteria bacterium]MBU4081943.1 hypothetical protein [Gammaproteobacteria bacterium]
MTLRISLYVIAAWLMGAHFLRGNDWLLLGLCVAAPLLFLYKSRWSLIVLQAAAYLASAIWLATALELLQFRQQLGRPWALGVTILAVVALFTLLAGALLNARCMRERYRF